MKFAKHLFISYAHIDNQPVAEGDVGWIVRLHRSLESILSMRLGRKAEIWRDERLQGNDVFADEIIGQFPDTALLVAVVTPRYLQSEWCTARGASISANGAAHRRNGHRQQVARLQGHCVAGRQPGPVARAHSRHPGLRLLHASTPTASRWSSTLHTAPLRPKLDNACARLAVYVADLVKRLEAEAGAAAQPVALPMASPPFILPNAASTGATTARRCAPSCTCAATACCPTSICPRMKPNMWPRFRGCSQKVRSPFTWWAALYGAVPDGPSQKSVVELQNELAVARARAEFRAHDLAAPRCALR